MPDSNERLIRAVDRTAGESERFSRSFARQLSAVLRDLERRLAELLSAAESGSRTAVVLAGQASRIRNDVRASLRAAGYDDLAEVATSAPLDRMTERVLTHRRLAGLSADLLTGTRVQIEAFRSIHLADLLDEAEEVSRAVSRAAMQGMIARRPVGAIVRDLGDVMDGSERRARTLYDTAVSVFGRQVEAALSEDDEDPIYAYLGPVDAKTRAFCLRYAGRVMTRKAIDALDNGQLPNPFLTGGGYNCRHQWTQVSRMGELGDLVGTRGRVPEVDRDVQAVRADE